MFIEAPPGSAQLGECDILRLTLLLTHAAGLCLVNEHSVANTNQGQIQQQEESLKE